MRVCVCLWMVMLKDIEDRYKREEQAEKTKNSDMPSGSWSRRGRKEECFQDFSGDSFYSVFFMLFSGFLPPLLHLLNLFFVSLLFFTDLLPAFIIWLGMFTIKFYSGILLTLGWLLCIYVFSLLAGQPATTRPAVKKRRPQRKKMKFLAEAHSLARRFWFYFYSTLLYFFSFTYLGGIMKWEKFWVSPISYQPANVSDRHTTRRVVVVWNLAHSQKTNFGCWAISKPVYLFSISRRRLENSLLSLSEDCYRILDL